MYAKVCLHCVCMCVCVYVCVCSDNLSLKGNQTEDIIWPSNIENIVSFYFYTFVTGVGLVHDVTDTDC